jgi:D-alanine-D-alanine ligase
VRVELDRDLAAALRGGSFDVAFPVVHGAVGEDGSLQGLLEILDLPYVGSGVLASALAMDKRSARLVFASEGLPIAPGVAFTRAHGPTGELARRAREVLGAALVVKPAASGSAIGVTRIEASDSREALEAAIDAAFALSETVILERFAHGAEATCGVLDLGEPVALPPTEIASPNDAFYTYQARYAPGRSVHACPPPWPEDVIRRVQAAAVGAYRALGCRDLARADFIVGDTGDQGRVTLLEVNTLPGFTGTSLYPEAAAVHGLSFEALTSGLVRRAFERGPTPRNAAVPLPG